MRSDPGLPISGAAGGRLIHRRRPGRMAVIRAPEHPVAGIGRHSADPAQTRENDESCKQPATHGALYSVHSGLGSEVFKSRVFGGSTQVGSDASCCVSASITRETLSA